MKHILIIVVIFLSLVSCNKKELKSDFNCFITIDTVARNPPVSIPAHFPIRIAFEGGHQGWTDLEAKEYIKSFNNKQILTWDTSNSYATMLRLECIKIY
jgi:hypothetical protein